MEIRDIKKTEKVKNIIETDNEIKQLWNSIVYTIERIPMNILKKNSYSRPPAIFYVMSFKSNISQSKIDIIFYISKSYDKEYMENITINVIDIQKN